MVACAVITIMFFTHDKGHPGQAEKDLSKSELVTLVCGVVFFMAFFMAMYVEVKAKYTIYKLIIKFIYLNQQWYIDEYNKAEALPVEV